MILLSLILLSAPTFASPQQSPAVIEERIYRDYQKRLLSPTPPRMRKAPSARLARISLDAIEDLLATGLQLPLDQIIPPKTAGALPPREQVRLLRLQGKVRKVTAAEERALVENISGAAPSPSILYELLRLSPSFASAEAAGLVNRMRDALPAEAALYNRLRSRAFVPPSAEEVKAIFTRDAGKPALYMFCRHNRNFKCLLALRDKDGRPVRTGSSLWTQPSLGLSSRGLPFNERGGYTPQGVHVVNGVMPEANLPLLYGKYRRMILEFVSPSPGEAEHKKLLPEISYGSSWWKEAVIARDMGRTELRIHGTGERSADAAKPYYPFVPTIGCVAQRELKYGDITHNDQRLLLDRLMSAGGLSPIFANEVLIQALLYVVELDDRSGAVGLADLARVGIL